MIKKKRFYLFYVFMFLATVIGFAQNQKTITGTVTDASGEPLIGVSITVKEKGSLGTITNFEGEFQLMLPKEAKTIVFSYIGYEVQELVIGSKAKLNVVMNEDTKQLNEVVVVGYGTQSKVSITGAVAAIDNKSIKQSPAPNLAGALAGRLSGLSVMQSSGQPGAENYVMTLRGASTLNGQNPLILVDGVPRDNITMLDPNEIASVSVLKDASSTAVFGVRGANGVILVTTKTGNREQPTLSISAELGRQDFTTDYDMIDSWKYATLRNETLVNGGLQPLYSNRQIQLYKDGGNPLYPNVNWFDEIFKDYALMNRYNVNLSGSTERVKYFVNVGLLNQGGIMNTADRKTLGYDPQFKLDRYNFRTNLDIKASDKITVGLKLAGYINKVGSPSSAASNMYQFFGRTFGMDPTTPIFPDASFGVPMDALISGGIVSPYGELNSLGYTRTDKSTLNSSLSLDYDLSSIIKGLSTTAMVSFDTKGSSSIIGTKTNYNIYAFSIREGLDLNNETIDIATFIPRAEYQRFGLSSSKSYSFEYSMNMQWRINYTNVFNNVHRVGAMALMQRDNSEAASGSNIDLLPHNVIGFAGRVTYQYSDKYMAEFNIGRNGSEQFAKGKRFGTFPAGSIGWLVSNEDFLRNNPTISNLKLRASYGKVGSDRIGADRFLYLDNNSLSNITGSLKGTSIGGGQEVDELLIGNPNLTWEIAYKQNYGLDMSFFRNSLLLTVDLFHEDRQNILISRKSVPGYLGNDLSIIPKENNGRVINKGIEVELSLNKKINKDLFLGLKATCSYAKNTVMESDELYLGDDYFQPKRLEGWSMGQNFGYLIDWNSIGKGYFTSQDEIDAYPTYDTKARPGDFVYKDLNGDNKIDDKDKTNIGAPSLPRINFSAMANIDYKSFDMSVMFQGIGQSSVYYSGYGIFENMTVNGFYQEQHFNAWTPERYANNEKISWPALSTSANSSETQNDFFIRDRSFVRLKNLEFGYTVPQAITKKIGVTKLRVYVNGQNLLTWDNLLFKIIDPEQKTTASVIPIQRVMNIGANINF